MPSPNPHPEKSQGPAGLPSWTSRCGRRPRSFRIRQAAGAGAVTSPSEMSKPSRRSSPTRLPRDFWDSLVQNLTFSRDCFSLQVGMTGGGCCYHVERVASRGRRWTDTFPRAVRSPEQIRSPRSLRWASTDPRVFRLGFLEQIHSRGPDHAPPTLLSTLLQPGSPDTPQGSHLNFAHPSLST